MSPASRYSTSDPATATFRLAPATAVGAQATARRVLPPQVLFDRPYLMLVTDSTTGEPLFLARVANPATP